MRVSLSKLKTTCLIFDQMRGTEEFLNMLPHLLRPYDYPQCLIFSFLYHLLTLLEKGLGE